MRFLFLTGALMVCSAAYGQVSSVVNGASFRTDQPLTAGSWATVTGNFAAVSQTVAPGYPIPKTLGGVTVTVGGVDAPVYYVSSNQINFLVPYAAQPGLRELVIRSSGGTVTGNIRIISAGPGLFIKEASGGIPPKGAILNQDFSENTQSNPIRRGQAIMIYATGPGALSQNPSDGVGAPSAEPLARTVSTPQVFIGGRPAAVSFSGLAPGFAGLWQINAVVPDQSFTGRVPVQVYMDGVESNEVAIFVAQ